MVPQTTDLSFIAFFRKLDLDYLCAARTVSFVEKSRWKDFNLGLQSVGLMRKSTDDEFEVWQV